MPLRTLTFVNQVSPLVISGQSSWLSLLVPSSPPPASTAAAAAKPSLHRHQQSGSKEGEEGKIDRTNNRSQRQQSTSPSKVAQSTSHSKDGVAEEDKEEVPTDPVVMRWLAQSEPVPCRGGHDVSTSTSNNNNSRRMNKQQRPPAQQRHRTTDMSQSNMPTETAMTTASSASPAVTAEEHHHQQQPQHSQRRSGSVNQTASPSGVVVDHSKSLAERSIVAHTSKRSTEAEHAFWKSRLRWLRTMVEQAEKQCSKRDASQSQREVSKALQQSVAAQLEAERKRDRHLLQEKVAANRVRREAHQTAMQETRQSLLRVRQELSREQKQLSSDCAIEVDEQRRRDLHRRTAAKEAVQESKVLGVLQRTLNQSMRAEEARRLYEHRILQTEEDDALQQRRTVEMIREGSRLVQKIRALQTGEGASSSSSSSPSIDRHDEDAALER